jgi:CheY-like chemotaxis protein/two-component sensor histidine kinase
MPETIQKRPDIQKLDAQKPKDLRSDLEIDRLKGNFLASLNHEIRTPLTGILGMADLLLETPLNPEQQDYVSTTRLCAETLFEVLNAALEYSALSSGHIEIEEAEFHLPEAIRGACADFERKANEKGLALYVTLDSQLPEVAIGDAVRIRQLLGHLLSNSIKFTPGGEVEVATSAFPQTNRDFLLTVSVRDTGIGIDEAQQQTIFESFQQLQGGLSRGYAGLGLGLALARQLARLLKGDLSLTSSPGQGSTFIFTIPLRLPEDRVPPEVIDVQCDLAPDDDPVIVPEKDQVRILVVEDNDVAQRVMRHTLERRGFSVFCVASGADALVAAATERFDLIIMDLQMPDMDGIETTRHLRKIPNYARIPIVACTANYSAEFRDLCLKAGMQDFVGKPIQTLELLSAINRLIQ